MTLVAAITAGSIGAILLTSGIVKLVDRERFERVLSQLDYVGPAATLLSVTVPITELGVAILLLLGRQSRMSLALAGGLLTVFAYVSANSTMNECGCGPFVPKRSAPRIAISLAPALVAAVGAIAGSTAPIGDRLLALGSTAVIAMMVNLLVGYRSVRVSR